jgi:hypothetical protein
LNYDYEQMRDDPYRELTLDERNEAASRGDWQTVDRYDRDSESGERAYREWRQGREFRDPKPDQRFS